MRADETRNGTGVERLKYASAIETFALEPDFPIGNAEALERISRRLGQRPVYQALVDTYGREATLEGLSEFMSPADAEIRVGIFVPLEVPKPSAES